jgi:uncharacterized RDD family membrane protein YckC
MKEKCFNHPEKQALNFCHSCGSYFCEECLVEGKEFYYCHGEQCIAAKSKDEPVIIEVDETLATTGTRICNLLLDSFFSVILFSIFGVVCLLIGLEKEIILGMNPFLANIIMSIIYYVPQETLSGRTIGKLITGTKAVSEDGTELTFIKALGRTLCRFIPFDAFSFLVGTGRPKGWHDTIPKTKVILMRK